MTDAVEWTTDTWNNPPVPSKPVDTEEEPFRNVPDSDLLLTPKRRQNDRVRVRTVLSQRSMTDKTQVGETDINEIIRKYRRSGVLPGVPPGEEQFADVSDISHMDYGEAVERLREAETNLHNARLAEQEARSAAAAADHPGSASDTADHQQAPQAQAQPTEGDSAQ